MVLAVVRAQVLVVPLALEDQSLRGPVGPAGEAGERAAAGDRFSPQLCPWLTCTFPAYTVLTVSQSWCYSNILQRALLVVRCRVTYNAADQQLAAAAPCSTTFHSQGTEATCVGVVTGHL